MISEFTEPRFVHCENARSIRWVFRIPGIQPGGDTEELIMTQTCNTARWMIMRFDGPYLHGYVIFKQSRTTNGVRLAFANDLVLCMPWRQGTISPRIARLLMIDQGNSIEFGLITRQGKFPQLTEFERVRALLNERSRTHYAGDFTPPGWVRHRIVERSSLFSHYDN
jgi:hypothetical protein